MVETAGHLERPTRLRVGVFGRRRSCGVQLRRCCPSSDEPQCRHRPRQSMVRSLLHIDRRPRARAEHGIRTRGKARRSTSAEDKPVTRTEPVRCSRPSTRPACPAGCRRRRRHRPAFLGRRPAPCRGRPWVPATPPTPSTPRPPYEALPAPRPDAAPSVRRIVIRSRSNVRMQGKVFPSPDGSETIAVITSGVNVVVDGIQNVPRLGRRQDRHRDRPDRDLDGPPGHAGPQRPVVRREAAAQGRAAGVLPGRQHRLPRRRSGDLRRADVLQRAAAATASC